MSIAKRAVLVSLNITKPKMTEKDAKATRETAMKNSASESAVAVVKRLYPKHLIQPITEAESSARRYMGSVTAPWARGLYLLPAALFMEFQDNMDRHRLVYEQAVTVFMNNVAQVLQEAARSLGDMYNAGDYPDLSQLRGEFSFGLKYYPLADAKSVVLDLEKKALQDLRENIEQENQEAMAAAMKDVRRRLYDAVQRIHTQCSKPDGKIYDSLTGNISELLRVLPALNLVEDKEFTALCDTVAMTLTVPAEAIRTQDDVRERTAKEAARISSLMEKFL